MMSHRLYQWRSHRCYQWKSHRYHHRYYHFLSFTSCSAVSVASSINRTDFSIDSTILIMSYISSFQVNIVDPFPALTAPFPLIYLSYISNIDKIAFVANVGKKCLPKRITRSNNTFLPKLTNVLLRNLPD